MTLLNDHRASRSFEHAALIYDSDEGYIAALRPVLEEACAAGDAVVAVVPHHNAALLRRHLDGRVDDIKYVNAEEWYQHPVATIASYDSILRALPPATRAFVIGEVRFGDTEADWAAWTRYEAALNRALHHHNARVVCPYDTRLLQASVIDDARRTHPYLLTDTSSTVSAGYVDPETLLSTLPPAATVPSGAPDLDLIVDTNLRAARHAFAAAAKAHGLPAHRVEELTVAVNEVLTNAILHGGGSARLRLWATGSKELSCVIDDNGTGVDDPLLGYLPPTQQATHGCGVWLARRLFDRSEFLPSTTGGLTAVLTAHAPARP